MNTTERKATVCTEPAKRAAERIIEEAQHWTKWSSETKSMCITQVITDSYAQEFNRFNDTDLPPEELLAKISDAVGDIKPDAESDCSGTILERVESAVHMAKRPDSYAPILKEAREALRDAEMFISAQYIDWEKFNHGCADYDPNYKPEFPPIVEQLRAVLAKLEGGV